MIQESVKTVKSVIFIIY